MTTTKLGVLLLLLGLLIPAFPGCGSPEDGRPRAGGHGGDAGNYVIGRERPPSKIDSTKDLSRIEHYGPGPNDWR